MTKIREDKSRQPAVEDLVRVVDLAMAHQVDDCLFGHCVSRRIRGCGIGRWAWFLALAVCQAGSVAAAAAAAAAGRAAAILSIARPS